MERNIWNLLGGVPACMLALGLLLSPSADALSGAGTTDEPYVIQTAADLAAMSSDLDGHYVLGGNINLPAMDFEPVGNEWDGPFTGTLDGRGYTISGLTVDGGDLKYAGLFGYLEGTVQNVTLSGVTVTGNRFAGGIAGTIGVGGAVTDCTVSSGTVTAGGSPMWVAAGGIAGVCEGTLTRCVNGADVRGDSGSSSVQTYAGGLAGLLSEPLTAENCSNSGAVVAEGPVSSYYGYLQAGGLFGRTDASVVLTGCANTGAVGATDNHAYAGGLIGSCQGGGRFLQCSNAGAVMGMYAGGLAGSAASGTAFSGCSNSGEIGMLYGHSAYYHYAGGLAGLAYGARFTDCSNSGAVTRADSYYSGDHFYFGGLTGYGGILTGCCNLGTVTGYYYAGGLSGSGEAITDCYNGGDVYSTGYAGGLSAVGGTITRSGNGGDVDASNSNRASALVQNTYSSSIVNCYNLGSCPNYESNALLVLADIPGHGRSRFELTPDGLYIDDGTKRYCTDIRVGYAGIASGALGYTLEELKQESTYGTIGSLLSMDEGLNSGLPMPLGIDVDYLSDSVLLLTAGETRTLTAPFAANYWESSDGAVATCSGGRVTANTVGTAVISARSADGRRANCIVFVYEPRDSVSFQSQAYALTDGSTLELETDLPDQDPQGMIWTSSDTSVATVDQTGAVTGQAAGTAQITVHLPLSGLSATCTVTVNSPAVTRISLSNASVNVGEQTALTCTLTPSNSAPSLTWRSGDETVATVENGVVTGHRTGSTTITATASNGVSGSCTVTVTQPASSVTLSETQVELEVGLTFQLTAAVEPENATDTLTWSSSNTGVVMVSGGLLTARGTGTAVVTVRASSGAIATCQVTVLPRTVLPQSVALSQTQARMAVGERLQVTAQVLPENATDPALTWSSSNPAVAEVSATGVVTALAPGSADIRAETFNGCYDLCQVRVVAASSAGFVLTDGRAEAGGTAETQVHIVKNPGIAAFTLEVTYDPAVLTPTAVTAGECLAGGTLSSNLDTLSAGEPFRITWYSAADSAENGLAFTIAWTTAGEAQTVPVSLSFEATDICNSLQEEVGFSVQGGAVTVLDRPVGDIYHDLAVNMKDIVYFARWFNGQETMDAAQEQAADIYFDGALDVKDLSALAQVLNSGLTLEAAPAPLLMSAEDTFRVTVSDARLDAGGSAVFTVSSAACPGVAAFRFGLDLPEGYTVAEIAPGADLPAHGTFSCNTGTGIVSWYSDQTTALAGELFTVTIRTDQAVPQFGALSLDYISGDFFQAEGYATVPVSVSAGALTGDGTARITAASLSGGGLTVEIESNSDREATMVAAFYSGEQMVAAAVRSVELAAGTHTYTFADVSGGAGTAFRLFLLDGGTLAPIAPSREGGA